MSAQDDLDDLPDAPPEIAEMLGKAMEQFVRETPLGATCPGCGKDDTKHVSIGMPDGEKLAVGKWTVVLPAHLFRSYCECISCGLSWDSEKA